MEIEKVNRFGVQSAGLGDRFDMGDKNDFNFWFGPFNKIGDTK